MTYQHFYRTTDPRIPPVHVLVTSDHHVQDLKQRFVCIKQGDDLAKADSVYTTTNPMPERSKGQVIRPAEDPSGPPKLIANALVFCFDTESAMLAFCEKSGAIEGTSINSCKTALAMNRG